MLAFDKFTGNEVISLSLGTVLHGFTVLTGWGEKATLLKRPWNPNKNVIA